MDYFDDTDLVESMQDIYREKKIPFVVIIDEWDCIFREYKQDVYKRQGNEKLIPPPPLHFLHIGMCFFLHCL